MKCMGKSTGKRGSLSPQTALRGIWEHRGGTHPRRGAGAPSIRACLQKTGKRRLNPGTAREFQALLGFQHLAPFTKGCFSSLKKQIIFWTVTCFKLIIQERPGLVQILVCVPATRSEIPQSGVQKLTRDVPQRGRELKGMKTQSHHLLMVWFGKGSRRMQQLTVAGCAERIFWSLGCVKETEISRSFSNFTFLPCNN